MGIRERIAVVVSLVSVLAGCAGAAPPESDDDAQPGQGKPHPGAPTNPGAGDDSSQNEPAPTPGGPTKACHTTSTLTDLAASPILTPDPIYRIAVATSVLEESLDGGKTYAAIDSAETGKAAEFAVAGGTIVVARSLGTKTAAGDDAYVLRKSADRGKTWMPAGSFASNFPGRMAVGSGGEIYVLMVGVVGGKIGAVMHAVDAAGAESESMIEQAGSTVAVYGADVHVMQSGNVVAATYAAAYNGSGNYQGASATFYSSPDKGKTWTQLTKTQVNSSNDLGGIGVTSDAAGNIYPMYMTATHNKHGNSKLVVSKGTTTFVPYDTYQPPAGSDFYVGFTSSSVDKDGTLRLAWQEFPTDGAQQVTSMKTIVRSIPASGTPSNVEVKRTGSDYTYVTRQRLAPSGSVLLEGFGFSKTTNAVTETFELGFVCR